MASRILNTMLRVSLGYSADSVPAELAEYLDLKLDAAASELRRINLLLSEDDPADRDLLVTYARWLYRKGNSGEARPPMLRQMINDRRVADATGGADCTIDH